MTNFYFQKKKMQMAQCKMSGTTYGYLYLFIKTRKQKAKTNEKCKLFNDFMSLKTSVD